MQKLKQEVTGILLANVKAVVDGYAEQWDEDLAKLFNEKSDMGDLEARKAALITEYSTLRPLVNKELERRNKIDREVHRLEKALSVARRRVYELTRRLTSVKDFSFPSPLLNFISAADFKPSYADLIKTKNEIAAEKKKLKKGK